jgi:heptosyltransferase II
MDPHITYVLPQKAKPVKRILAVRLQATGDVMIALPYLYDLKCKLPEGTILDLMVREEAARVPQTFTIFDSIHVLKGGRNTKLQFLSFLWQYPKLYFKGYDVMLDVQNIRLTKVIRKLLQIKAWCTFDRTSTHFAGDRYKNTINVMQLAQVQFKKTDCFKKINEEALLHKFGLKKEEFYIAINPAGAFENRNWPLDKYVEFCKLWLQNVNKEAKFLVLGTEKIEKQAAYFKEKLGDTLINLVGDTTQQEALHLLRHVQLMVSDDSGLMHMSYCLGNPTIGILGSTRNDWTNPNLPHTYFFNSSDLECGNCMLEKCKFDEIKCLTRVKAEMVLQAAVDLLKKNS